MPNDYQTLIDRGRVRGTERLSLDDCAILDRTARAIDAKTILEIGSAAGTSTMLLGRVVHDRRPPGRMLSLDPRPEKVWQENIAWAGLTDVVTLRREYSPWSPWLLDPKLCIDYLFIDGEHKTRWALVDYHCWEKMVRPGGRIAFHDIYGPRGPEVQTALALILKSDAHKLREIARGKPARDRGVVVFQKLR